MASLLYHPQHTKQTIYYGGHNATGFAHPKSRRIKLTTGYNFIAVFIGIGEGEEIKEIGWEISVGI